MYLHMLCTRHRWIQMGASTLCACHMPTWLGPCRRAGGLRCLSLTSELGESTATLTPALLEAVLSFQPPPRQQQRQRPRRRRKPPKPRPPLAELLPRLLARAPQQVGVRSNVLISVQFMHWQKALLGACMLIERCTDESCSCTT
jgi:hypothetical protein